jgi:hypothetical protein
MYTFLTDRARLAKDKKHLKLVKIGYSEETYLFSIFAEKLGRNDLKEKLSTCLNRF